MRKEIENNEIEIDNDALNYDIKERKKYFLSEMKSMKHHWY